MFESGTRLAAEVGDDVERFWPSKTTVIRPVLWRHTFHTRIRRNIRLAEARAWGTRFQYAPQSHGAEDYRRLALEVHTSEQDFAGDTHPHWPRCLESPV